MRHPNHTPPQLRYRAPIDRRRAAKKKTVEQQRAEMEEFLARGGEVEELPPCGSEPTRRVWASDRRW